jgi:hypothetical protein
MTKLNIFCCVMFCLGAIVFAWGALHVSPPLALLATGSIFMILAK